MKSIIALSVLLFAGITGWCKDNDNNVPSTLKKVIVYRSGAEMTHTASATLKQGNNQLIIENISNQVDINSIQVKTPATVTILGVEFSGNYLQSTEKSSREKMLGDSLEKIQQDEEKIDLSISNTTDLLAVLKENRNIKGEQTGLSVAELTKLMDYYNTKSLELQSDLQQFKNKKKKLEELAAKIQNQITEEQKKEHHNIRQNNIATIRRR